MKREHIYWSIIAFLVVVVVGLSIMLFMKDKDKSDSEINSFEECAAAGYPIMESYPEQCKTPDGKTFVRELGVNDPAPDEVACTMDAMECPDGSYVGRIGPNCEFAPCPGASDGSGTDGEEEIFCTLDAKMCPDGSYVGRVAPSCEFAACPGE